MRRDAAFYACEPQKIEKAIKKVAWIKAMNKEMTVIEKNYT